MLPAVTIEVLRSELELSEEEFCDLLTVLRSTLFRPDIASRFTARVHRGRLERWLIKPFEEEIHWDCEIKAGADGSPPLKFPSHIENLTLEGKSYLIAWVLIHQLNAQMALICIYLAWCSGAVHVWRTLYGI